MRPGRPTTLATMALAGMVLCSTTARAQDEEGVVVMPPKSTAIKATALTAINDLLVMAMTDLSPDDVVTYADIEAQLDHDQKKQLLDCDATECAAEMGGALGKRYLLTAKASKLGNKIIITLSLIDNREQKVVRAQAKGQDDENLYDQLIDVAVRDLLKRAGITARAKSTKPGFAETAIGEQPPDWDAGGEELVLVRLESEPAGAVVMANGRLVCSATPCQKTLNAGSFAVAMQKERYEPAQQRVTVVEGMAAVVLRLEPSFGLLSVTSEPSGLSVKVDGELAGTTPLSQREVSPGGHEVLVTDPRYYDQGRRLVVEKGEHRELALELTPKEGQLVVTAQDSKGNDVAAEVSLGGKALGLTPLSQRVMAGEHELNVQHPQHGSFTNTVTINEREKTSVRAALQVRVRVIIRDGFDAHSLASWDRVAGDISLRQGWLRVMRTGTRWGEVNRPIIPAMAEAWALEGKVRLVTSQSLASICLNELADGKPKHGYCVTLNTKTENGSSRGAHVFVDNLMDNRGSPPDTELIAYRFDPGVQVPHEIRLVRTAHGVFDFYVDGVHRGSATNSRAVRFDRITLYGMQDTSGGHGAEFDDIVLSQH